MSSVPARILPSDLRILHVLDHSLPLHSGYSFRTIALLKEQRRLGWNVSAVTSSKHTLSGADREIINGITFYRTKNMLPLTNITGVSEIALILSLAERIKAAAQIEKPHILHAHSPVLNALACFIANRKLQLPILYEVRAFWEDAAIANGTAAQGSARYRFSKWLETYALKQSDAVTTICTGLKLDMTVRGIPESKITIIPNGVDLAEFPMRMRPESAAVAALRRQLKLDGKTTLAFLGSFYPYEGLALLLEAMPTILKQWPDVRIVLAGGGPQEAELRSLATARELTDAVIFAGRIPHDEIADYYGLADILVFPRLPSRLTETVTPLKPLEAMASGGIALASNVGGHRELISHGETGYLFEAGSSIGLAEALSALLQSRGAWNDVRERARKFVETERNWTRCASGYARAYSVALHAVRDASAEPRAIQSQAMSG